MLFTLMAFEKNTSPGFLANHLARLFAIELKRRLKPLDLSPGQFPALLALYEQDGQTQKDLVDLLDIDQTTLAKTLTRMQRDELILRKAHPEDARARIICLTDKARQMRATAIAAAQAQNDAALSDLSPEETATFIALMQRVIRTMQKDSANEAD